MLQTEADIGIGSKVKHAIAAPHRFAKTVGVEQIAADEPETRVLAGIFYELDKRGRQIVVRDHLTTIAQQPVDQIRTDEACTTRYETTRAGNYRHATDPFNRSWT